MKEAVSSRRACHFHAPTFRELLLHEHSQIGYVFMQVRWNDGLERILQVTIS
jgi:hypothetical protein